MTTIMLTTLAVLLGANTLLWLLSLRLRDASIIDIYWGVGFIIVAWVTRMQLGGAAAPESILLPVAASLWGVRLAVYLGRRNIGHGEDKRYAAMRARRPEKFWWWSFFWVFMLQGSLCFLVSLPLQVGQLEARPRGVGFFDVAGMAVFLFGLVFEAVADAQLARFKADPASAGKVMDRGLWRYTRHPNYFGEAVIWWGVWLMAAAAPDARWTVISPIAMTWLLLKFSGVSLLEETIVDRRPKYADYIRRTNAFIPGRPRSG